MRFDMLFADSFLQFLPPFSTAAVFGLLAAAAAVGMLLGWLLGPANPVARRAGLWTLRGLILALITLVILNPVRVQQLPGPVQQPEIFYLLDASASMQMGNPQSRWDHSLEMIAQARQQAAASAAVVKPFRFGQRLAAIQQPDQPAIAPTDGDTRLQAALKQISSRFGRVPPLGLVVFSDGRAHDETGLEQIAAEFGKLKLPIHVAPMGDMERGGDVAIAAVVAPPRVRKYTEVEVQVFLRSFGYDGKRGQIDLWEVGEGQRPGRKLASLPVTLQSGYQSVSLAFRTDQSTRRLRVQIPTVADEVSSNNNQLDTEMAIDRTKIRVLYVEGSSQPLRSVRVGTQTQYQGPFSDLKRALTEDEDIDCVVMASPGGIGRLVRLLDQGQTDGSRGFPSVAELSAFDAIILSDVSADAFTETQLGWIEEWARLRGGGLCMVGGARSFASGGWDQTPLADMLPVDLQSGGDWLPGENIRVTAELPASPHPIWEVVSDDQLNRQVVGELPDFMGANRWAGARPNLATVIATTEISGSPAMPADNVSAVSRGLSTFIGALARKPAATSATANSAERLPAIVVGRYGRGRTLAAAFPITAPYAADFAQKWGVDDNRYYAKFCRNLVYWLTENSAIGRRRLVAAADKRFYRPGETITIQAATYDESSARTRNYRVMAMLEPKVAGGGDVDSDTSPIKWPSGLARDSGESGPYMVWGEEFALPLGGQDAPVHSIQLPLADTLASGASSQSMRVELTAYEDFTQVDSTSLDIQVLHDPYEQQNPFPNHELLTRIAGASGGKVLNSAAELAALLNDVPVNVGPPIVKRLPLWSNWWVLGLILGLLTVEWCWRRRLGLA